MAISMFCMSDKREAIKEAIAREHSNVELIAEQEKHPGIWTLVYSSDNMMVSLTAMQNGAGGAGLA